MYNIRTYLTVLLMFATTLIAQGQKSDHFHYTDSTFLKIKTTDGSEIYGYYRGVDQHHIIISAESMGKIYLQKVSVKEIKVVKTDRIHEGLYWFENPNATRYLFSPTAIPLRRGEGYYQNSYLLINMFNIGATDHFSMGGGFELISTFTGNPTLFITPKVSGQVGERTYLGIGAIAGFHTLSGEGSRDMSGLGICYGVATFGNRENNITTGLGFGFAEGSFQDKPFITLSGMRRVSRKLGFVSENWLIPSDGYDFALSYALRFMSEKITVDFGFINNRELARMIFIGIPYVDFVVKFGK